MSDMNQPDSQEDLKEACARLQHQLESTLILTCVISITLAVFFGINFRGVYKEVQAMRPVVEDYRTKTQPALQDLSVKLVEYAKTHPDIQPLLNKYGVAVPTNAATAPKK